MNTIIGHLQWILISFLLWYLADPHATTISGPPETATAELGERVHTNGSSPAQARFLFTAHFSSYCCIANLTCIFFFTEI